MRGLLYKEFFLLKGNMIFMAVFQLIMTGVCILLVTIGLGREDRELTILVLTACYYLPFFIMTIVTQELFAQDEKCPWSSFVGATPQGQKGQIACKYCVILIENLLLLLCCFLTDALVVAVTGDTTISMVLVGMFFFCFRIFLQAIEIPFLMRFGTHAGGAVKGAVQAIILFAAICYGLFGNISFLFSDDPVAAFFVFFSSGHVLWVLAVIPYVAVAAYFLSYRISLRIYKGVDYVE